VVEDRGHWALPLCDQRQPVVLERAALAGPFEGDDAASRIDHRGQHRQKLLNVAVVSAEDDDGRADLALWAKVVGG